METAAGLVGRLPERLHRVRCPSRSRADLRRRLGQRHPWEDGFDFTPPAASGLASRAARLRRRWREPVRHRVVVSADRRPPGCGRRPEPADRPPLLLALLPSPAHRRRRRPLLPVVPPAPGGFVRRVDSRATPPSPGWRRCWPAAHPKRGSSSSCAIRSSASVSGCPGPPSRGSQRGGDRGRRRRPRLLRRPASPASHEFVPPERILVLQLERCVSDWTSAAGGHLPVPRPR